ncbi:PREDICTED: sodium/potassium/calcium exchanger 2 isoform X2 [Nanorana parkeri]|uniref:sodium/potassium/calcium exchanger 2 isoform X2 n=1 Tax=Nanorana parkeri TaxID=125878 RepID=UPI00085427DE|nr:PREDICTED: sodium/potassium/calcium exchanger 2 isoform X2 [Nanorana parkeri]
MGLHARSAGDLITSCCLGKTLSHHSHKHPFVHKKLRFIRILGLFLCITAISTLSSTVGAFLKTELYNSDKSSATHSHILLQRHQRNLMDFAEQNQNDTPGSTISMNYKAGGNKSLSKGEYPEDIFSLEDRKRGAVVLHIFGMIYMFIALAVVCDEFFVPSLTVITEKLMISDDVAGATFMAAGGSAPELFTSLIGVFISHSNVGIGTIVGSAVFNILFVIGMCALFSKEVLNLTWWPLFRDVTFYIVGLIMLITFFLDNIIQWWESLMLLMAYLTYVTFMKFNVQVESWVKRKLNRNKVVKEHREQPNILVLQEEPRTPQEHEGVAMNVRHGDVNETAGLKETWTETVTSPTKTKPRLQRGGSSASLHNSLMRNSIFQLMIHTLDPLSEEIGSYGKLKYYDTMTEEGKFKEKASILNKMAKMKCQVEDSERLNGAANCIDKVDLPNSANVEVEVTPPKESDDPIQNGNVSHNIEAAETQGTAANMIEEGDQPLSLAWPTNQRKRAVYLAVLPIIFPLWITLPDVRNDSSRKFFPVTFFGSITWIAIFSYLMVWWAHQVGETIGITEEIMGLTILAAGTSIPDLITSVIVARKGLGDMAVSSSVGSNIFDITVGLPMPWLLYAMFHRMKPVAVSSNGLFCAIILLFIMLLFVILSIALCKWKMNKVLGCMMFGLYLVFLVISVLLENRIILCPVTV